MVGKIIAWFLRRAGYELTPAVEVAKKLTYLHKKAEEIDDVCCSLIDDIAEMRKAEAVQIERPADSLVAEVLNEYFYGYQQKWSDDE